MRKIISFAAMFLIFTACENYYMEGKIKTFDATNITENSALLSGKVEISYKGNEADGIKERGFIVSNGFQYTIGKGEGNFSFNIENLTPNTLYEAKAYASLAGGYVYGNIIKFTTKEGNPLNWIELSDNGIAVQKTDLGNADWVTAKTMCENSRVGGFTDWRLPTKAELLVLYNQKATIGGFSTDFYWSSTENNSYSSCYVSFFHGMSGETGKSAQCKVRAVRTLP